MEKLNRPEELKLSPWNNDIYVERHDLQMITNNTKINIRERLERLRPASNLFAPQRFALPQNYVVSEMKQVLAYWFGSSIGSVQKTDILASKE